MTIIESLNKIESLIFDINDNSHQTSNFINSNKSNDKTIIINNNPFPYLFHSTPTTVINNYVNNDKDHRKNNNTFNLNNDKNNNNNSDQKKSPSFLELTIGGLALTGVVTYAVSKFMSKKFDLDLFNEEIENLSRFMINEDNVEIRNDLKKIITISQRLLNEKKTTSIVNTGGIIASVSTGVSYGLYHSNMAGYGFILSSCCILGYNIYDYVYKSKIVSLEMKKLCEEINNLKQKY